MTRRILLVRHAAPAATRAAAFGADGPIGEGGRTGASLLRRSLPRTVATAGTSPARCASETAAALGLPGAPDAGLADWNAGAWAGRTLDDVGAADPEGVAAWRSDPAFAPPGGEPLLALLARAARWLDTAPAGVAVTHAAIVRACVVRVLGAPPSAFWALDVAPLSVTELHERGGRWQLARVNWTARVRVEHRAPARAQKASS